MTSFAIYEFVALIVALPISYAMAWLARKYTYATYKNEVDRLYSAVWNGNEEDELNALLKVYSLFIKKKAPKKRDISSKKIEALNKQKIYSTVLVDEKGQLKNTPKPNEMDPDQI